MRNILQQYRLVVGMHSVNLVTNEFRRCFLKGEILVFSRTFILLRAHRLYTASCLNKRIKAEIQKSKTSSNSLRLHLSPM